MCGISGIIFDTKQTLNQSVLSSSHLLDHFNDLKKIYLSKTKLKKIYDLSWNYKNNKNFINFFKDTSEQENIKKIISKIDKFINKIDYLGSKKDLSYKLDNVEILKDIHWFFKNELWDGFNFVSKFLKHKKDMSNDSAIIFFKNLSFILNSINFLEMRGRDSLGVSINLNIKKNFNDEMNNINNLKFIQKYKSYTALNFVFKISNSVGYLGENSNNILEQIRNNEFFTNLIFNEEIINGSIICHTRWASVGKVNDYNCHPISNYDKKNDYNPKLNAFVNGDIYNYKEIINETRDKYNLSSNCSSDTLAVPYVFTDKKFKFNNSFVKKKINKLVGSYVLALESDLDTNKLLVAKSGDQGLYIGQSDENFIFSSDVYGLVEKCHKYFSIPSGYFFYIDKKKYNFSLTLYPLNRGKQISLKNKDFKNSVITTRDISKMKYSHYLEKEINQTESILNRTIHNCVSHIKLSKYNSNFFGDQFNKIDPEIITKIKENSFNEIIITGMGTCYTAAVVISRYMRKIFRTKNPKIIIQPHIASEASAFYLKSNMKNTLVIVIAQSGTTIDTNVYVKLSKKRGAKTISIVNKRDGDITFLVDSSIFLGNGRDIEMAVPSTKTYIAHVITGYLLTLFFYSKLNKYDKIFLFSEIKKILKTPSLAKKSIKSFHKLNLNKETLNRFLSKKDWFMIHDDSEMSASCQEVRIKLSECCYSSIPYHSIEYLKFHKIKKALILLMVKDENSISKNKLKELSKDNYIFMISKNISHLNKNIFFLKVSNTNNFLSFIPSVIYGQLLSYKIALSMDERKKYIQELIDKEFNQSSKNNLKNYFNKNLFIKGLENNEIEIIKSLIQSKNHRNNYMKALKTINIIKRPIDTIKHQAKTITVGTQRIQKKEKKYLYKYSKNQTNVNINLNLFKQISNFLNQKSIVMRQKENIFFYSLDFDESIIYFVVNYLNNLSQKFNINKNFHLARSYDLNSIIKDKNNLLINFNFENLSGNIYCHLNIFFADILKIDNDVLIIKKETLANYVEANKSINLFNFCNNFLLAISNEYKFKSLSKYIYENQTFLTKILDSFSKFRFNNNIITKISNLIKYRNNIKIIGSGVNYNVSKISSKLISKSLNLACAYDVLENHKHIDMSAEPLLFIFISNIKNSSYQMDAKSEIEKFISHGNIPIIVVNSGDTRFDDIKVSINGKLNNLITIKIDDIYEDIAFIPSLILIEILLESLK